MDKEALKAKLPEYLEARGVILEKLGSCIVCGSGNNTPCAGYHKAKNVYHCFSCGVTWDILDFIANDNNLDIKEEFREVCQIGYSMYGLESENPKYYATKSLSKDKKTLKADTEAPKDYTSYYHACNKNLILTDYLEHRGLSSDTAKRFNLGYDIDSKCLVIPVTKSFYIKRSTDLKRKSFLNLKGTKIELFNAEALGSEQTSPIIITESAIDSISIMQLGGISVGLNGVSNVGKLVELIKSKDISNRYIVALDNDQAGASATNKLVEAFKAYGIRYTIENLIGEYKDPNEALVKDPSMLEKNIFNAINSFNEILADEEKIEFNQYAVQYKVSEMIEEFYQDIKSNVHSKCISTGFTEFDKYLDGGFRVGLYFIGAISTIGKTTFALQIADNISRAGNDVLVFALEMTRYELIAKSISRLSYIKEKNWAKTMREIMDFNKYAAYSEEERKHITDCMDTYQKETTHLYIVEGSGSVGITEIEEKVKEHIRLTKRRPVVIIDYLQLLILNNSKMTDKQNMDQAVLRLKCLSREQKITIIGISSLNRESYVQPISMAAFKESGAIEYTADVLIGLQFKGVGERDFNLDKAKTANPRAIEVVILKNRNGIAGKKIDYLYNPRFNIFIENGSKTSNLTKH